MLNESSRKNIPGRIEATARGSSSSLSHPPTRNRPPPPPVSGSAIFFITFLISYPPASVTVIQIPIVIYVDINGNPSVSWRPPPSLLRFPPSASKGRPPLTLLVQILCFIESELSLLLLPSRRSPLSRSFLRLVCSFHGCQTFLSLSLCLSPRPWGG